MDERKIETYWLFWTLVVGKYLYIHGGEITVWNGTGAGFAGADNMGSVLNSPSMFFNARIWMTRTHSVRLQHLFDYKTTSWTNSTLELNAIESKAPRLIMQALWKDALNQTFYRMAADSVTPVSYRINPLNPQMSYGDSRRMELEGLGNLLALELRLISQILFVRTAASMRHLTKA